jgi:hypothetical protein
MTEQQLVSGEGEGGEHSANHGMSLPPNNPLGNTRAGTCAVRRIAYGARE